MTATTDVNHTFITETGRAVYPVNASALIYAGVFVGENVTTGGARPLVAGDKFLGISTEYVDNSTGLTGAKNVEVKVGKLRLMHNVVGATSAIGTIGVKVYASDDNTLTLTSTANTLVGTVVRWISGTLCEVHIDTLIQYY